MAINELIAQGFKPVEIESPMNQLAKVMQMRQAQQSIDQGDMKQQEYRTGLERKNKLIQLMSGLPADATDEQRSAALKGGGYFTEADALDKGSLERRKIGSESAARDIETSKKKIDLAGSAFKYAMDNPTLENAHSVIDYLGANQVYTPEEVTHWKAQVAANPANIRQLAETAFRSALAAKDQLAKNTSENLGGNMAYNSVDPVTGKVTQTGSAPITQSANSTAEIASREKEGAANRGVTIRGQNLTNERTKDANGKGQYDAERGLLIDQRTGQARQVIGADGQPIAPKSTGVKLTEDQGKATGWLVQAENAFKNMQSSGFDQQGNRKSAAVPGFNDAIGAIPGMGGAANLMRSEDRQKFIQASSSMSEALLRAATGAGVNESEAKQKIAELTPVFGEAESVTKQKMGAIPLYIESLKVRAGPGAAQAAAITAVGKPTSTAKTPNGATVSGW